MLSRYNPVDIEAALRKTPASPPFPAAADRTSWEAIRQATGPDLVAHIIAQAEKDTQTTLPVLPATLYLECVRSGQREGYEHASALRHSHLTSLALGECLEGTGRFLDPLTDVIWAICEESSWAWPPHQFTLTDMTEPYIDLGVAMTSLALAEADALLGAALDPLVGKRIRYEVDRRAFTPYLTRHDFWWLYNHEIRMVNNWTAVCNGGIIGAALYLEPDLSRLAEMIARAARSLDDYLATFDADGGSSEGPGYWSYGFGYYTILAHLIEQRSGGKISLWSEEVARKAATFPLHTELANGVYVNFSDCDADIHFNRAQLVYLSQRLNLPDLMRLARVQPIDNLLEDDLTWPLRVLAWHPADEPAGRFVSGQHDWYGEMMWMIARNNPADPDTLVLAAKGGHNEEMHNQNDVGSIIVYVNGESVIPDLGRGRYTKAYFDTTTRYGHFVNSSRGHSVPIVNGQEQCAGIEYRSELIEHRVGDALDVLSLEMAGAYPKQADIAWLKRTIALQRDGRRGRVELVDDVTFASAPGLIDSVLTTFAEVAIAAGSVLLRGEKATLKVTFDPAIVTAGVSVEKDVDLAAGQRDVNLVKFRLTKPARQASIALRIEPM
jgi:hypothetical protein